MSIITLHYIQTYIPILSTNCAPGKSYSTVQLLYTFQSSPHSHACERGAGGRLLDSSFGSRTGGHMDMRQVVVEAPLVGPPGTNGPDIFRVDDGLRVDAHSLTLVQERFPGFCPYHILHNLLGGHYSRHSHCTAAPFADVTCNHGSHARPNDADSQRTHCPALGSVVFLPLVLDLNNGMVTLVTYR